MQQLQQEASKLVAAVEGGDMGEMRRLMAVVAHVDYKVQKSEPWVRKGLCLPASCQRQGLLLDLATWFSVDA